MYWFMSPGLHPYISQVGYEAEGRRCSARLRFPSLTRGRAFGLKFASEFKKKREKFHTEKACFATKNRTKSGLGLY